MNVFRTLVTATATLVFVFVPAAQATASNVVPNAGFEQGGCGDTPGVCDWEASPGSIGQDGSNPHSGNASLSLLGYSGLAGAVTDADSCVAIGAGRHAASFWYRTPDQWGTDEDVAFVGLSASFWTTPDCTGTGGATAELSEYPAILDDTWHQVVGEVVAPPGTASVSFGLSIWAGCNLCFIVFANFDDLYVEHEVSPPPDDDFPTISSFTPTSGPVGTSVTITGTNFTGATSVSFYGREASFTVDSPTSITAVVPSGATTGQIMVNTPKGGVGSSTAFTVTAPPQISSFMPLSGTVGSSVTVVGSGFTGVSSVKFTGTAASFTFTSDSEIHATVPNGAVTGPIFVTTPLGEAASPTAFTVTGPLPAISSFSPTSGPIGTDVEILGSNFTGATGVRFFDTPAGFTLVSDAEIHATVPGGATTGQISVTTPNGTNISAASFTVITDTTPPQTTITSGPSGTTSSRSATFEFAANEPSTFECTLDSAAFTACASPETYNGFGDGSHTFRVRATDAAGNTDPTAADRTWTIATNTPPIARFSFGCSALSCNFDASGSSDSDGTIDAYTWSFGDEASGSGRTAEHSYSVSGAYTVTLTVTDDTGATATESRVVKLIRLTARGYKVRGLQKVDLAWSDPSGASFDVYRNGARIATVEATAYTDSINRKGSANYTYRVCAPATSTCSNDVTVSF